MNKEYLNHIERLMKERPHAAPALSTYREMVRLVAQSEFSHPLKKTPRKAFDISKKEGAPLFRRQNLPINLSNAASLLHRILHFLSEQNRKDRSGLSAALMLSRADETWSRALFLAVLSRNESAITAMAEKIGLDPLTLLFLGKTAMRPSLESLRAEVHQSVQGKNWRQGYCPVCGSQPDMACLDLKGRRQLHCELCGQKWAFDRLKCPFCGSRDAKNLGYLKTEGEDAFRIYVCDACHRYLKTVDVRSADHTAPLELENLATLHLDMVATENGYR